MSTQSAYDKNRADAAARKQKAENDRKAAQTKAANEKKVKSLNSQNANLRKEIDKKYKPERKKLNDQMSGAQKQYNDYYDLHKNDPGFDPNAIPYLTSLAGQIASLDGQIKGIDFQIKIREDAITKNKKEIEKLTPKPAKDKSGLGKKEIKSTNDANAPQFEKVQFTENYKYNAPMVRDAYFGPVSLVNDLNEGNRVDQGAFSDARQAWQGVTGGRGVIQMDKKFLSTFSTNDIDIKNFDFQKYGFKFLYNPQTVSMAWGLIQNMDPYFEATGMDKFQVVSTALMASTVSFELLLNRVEDFKYIDENGLKSSMNSRYMSETTREQSKSITVTNPYPETVPTEDLKEIYQKGTMYDLEYLLRVINGPNANFNSELNGKTADRGWLKPVIIELHLGNAMRYRIRMSEFSVNHVIFDNRMVPILSTVRLTCSRFADGLPDKVKDSTHTTFGKVGANGQRGLPKGGGRGA